MGSNCCKGDAAGPVRSNSSIYTRYLWLAIVLAQEIRGVPWPLRPAVPLSSAPSRAGASLDDRFAASDDAGGVRLTVSAAQTGDSGVYTLQASNAVGSAQSRVRLQVSADEAPTGHDPPAFLRRLQDLTVKVGTRTRFLVEIVSSTECKVTWFRNDRRLMEAERVSLARDGHFWCADIAAVSVDDAGRWTCTAENDGGRASCSAHLNVLVPKAYKRPEFVEELRALLTEQGTVSLECKVVGVPTPVLRWFKDSREIKAGDVFALTANAEDPTSLGTYTCEAVNCMGRAYSSSKVHVVGRSREGSAKPSASVTPEPPPIFTKELEDQFVRINEPLSLSCHIVVPPWPRAVVWYNKDGKVDPGERYHAIEDGVGGYLMEVRSAEWADEGEWKCVATSAGGRVGISTCYVTMDVPKNYRKPRFMENLQAVLTEEGLVSFECKVVGFPTPVLSWFKDGQELKPGDVYQLTGTNSLGSYCCIARNCMGQASSSAELTVEDIQNQLNEEEKLQLFSKNQAPKFLQGLKSVEAKIDDPFRFTIKVAIPPEPSVLWYRDDQPVDETARCHHGREEKGLFYLDIQNLEFLDQAEWKCVAMNDFGHSVTSCFLKLVIPRHYKKPRFLENLQAVLSDEGAVNLECKVIGVPQPILKWYKDGEELKPGDIHRIISGQDGTCCLGTYTCEAQNCMGIASSSASLLGIEDSMKAKKKKTEELALQRNLSLSTIHEERTSQIYDTPVGDITLDDKGEISFSFDGKEVSVSLYETPDLTEEEALQIVEMYADQLSENVTEHNVVELPPLRFVKETSTSGNLLMEAIIIDVSPDYFASPEEDLRTEADIEDISIADEHAAPQLSLDTDIGGEDYLEKTMALLSNEKSDIPKKSLRRKSDSVKSGEDYFSVSPREQSLSEEKKDDDTQISESFASARSSTKIKSKSLKPSDEDAKSTDVTKTMILKDEIEKQVASEVQKQLGGAQKQASEMIRIETEKKIIDGQTEISEQVVESTTPRPKRERRSSRSSRRSSSGSEKSLSRSRDEPLRKKTDSIEKVTVEKAFEKESPKKPEMSEDEFKTKMTCISSSLSKIINEVQLIERDIILKSELMSSAATASRSLEIISSIITPLSELHSVVDAIKESIAESKNVSSTLFNNIPQPLKLLQQPLTIIEKCVDVESENKTLVKKTCVAFIENCGNEIEKCMSDLSHVTTKEYLEVDDKILNEIDSLAKELITIVKYSAETVQARNLLSETNEIKSDEPTFESKHLRDTQKAVFELRSPLNSLLCIAESADSGKTVDVTRVKSSEVILTDMSASIQDLQMALEQIESLSVKESTTSLHKYNTQIIETVMDSVLKLRTSFEELSPENRSEEDKAILKQAIISIKQNLSEISSHIDKIEHDVGVFDILQSDNKLEVLQKMAQILIMLENNLPRLETMPEVKSHVDAFHKNLTKVLENVIESNDAQKYFTFMEICDAVNRLNNHIKNVDSDPVLSLASLTNTLKIVQDLFVKNVFEPELNCAILTNISDVLVDVEEAIHHAEEMSVQLDSEHLRDIPMLSYETAKAKIIIDHIDLAIAAINNVKSLETAKELKSTLSPVLETISPILEEIRQNVASVQTSEVPQKEYVSELSASSFVQTLATPVCELNQNIEVLNHMIVENITSMKDNPAVLAAIAEPLHELHTTLQILQQDVVSQYNDDVESYNVSLNVADAVQNLRSCIVMIQEQAGVEGVDDMSTLEDISGIKTTADTIPSDHLVLPTAEQPPIEYSLEQLNQELATSATAQALQTLNDHITVLQMPDVLDALDSLSEVSDFSSLKSVALGLGELHTGIEEILHPIIVEHAGDIGNLINVSKLTAIAEPMQELHQSLSIVDTSNIPIYEEILEMPAERLHSVFKTVSEFKKHLEKCIQVVFPAMETADKTIEISNKVETLRDVCENLKEIIKVTKTVSHGAPVNEEVLVLEDTVNNLLDATDVSKGIKIESVKCLTEQLYQNIITVQEDVIQFTPHTPEKLTEEAKLMQTLDEIEGNIAVLEQYEFVDLSRASDIASCTSPQLAMELDSEPLMQMGDIVENAVNVVQDSAHETSVADLMIIEDFFKTCKSEFTILRCLMNKQLSHKKIIRLLQEFNALQNTINIFKEKRHRLTLPDDIDSYLSTFLIHAEECLKSVKNSLVKIVRLQSDVLVKTPLKKINDTSKMLLSESKRKISPQILSLAQKFDEVVDASKTFVNNLEDTVITELQEHTQQTTVETKGLSDKMEEIVSFIEKESFTEILDVESKQVFEKVLNCLHRHADYKDASGSGKTLIILKCLAECSDLLQESMLEKQSIPIEVKFEENTLKAVLTEMMEPLQALHGQLVDVQKQILSGKDEDSISFDMASTESLVKTMTDMHKEILLVESKKNVFDNEEVSLIVEMDKEMHSIQDSLRAMENKQAAELLKKITKPMEDIEKSLHHIISSDKVLDATKGKLSAEKAKELTQHIDQYLELIEIVEEISAVIKIENLQETANTARELRESIAASETIVESSTGDTEIKISSEQRQLAQQLQSAVTNIQAQVSDSTQELAPEIETEILQRIAKDTAQLQADLVAVAEVQVPLQAPADRLIELDEPSKKIIQATAEVESAQIISPAEEAESSKPIVLKSATKDQMTGENPASEHLEASLEKTTKTLGPDSLQEEIISSDVIDGVPCAETTELVVFEPETHDIAILQVAAIAQKVDEELPVAAVAVTSQTQPTVSDVASESRDSESMNIKEAKLVQHIEEFTSPEVLEMVERLSASPDFEGLKECVAVAKQLKETIAAVEILAGSDETIEVAKEARVEQLHLEYKLQDSLSTVQIMDAAVTFAPNIEPEDLQKVADVVLHLQEDLEIVTNACAFESEPEIVEAAVDGDAMQRLERLLQEVNNNINVSPSGRTADDNEILRDTLDEVQTVIIKLKCDTDGSTDDTLNETLEDLECNVRSVQLQINEESPPEILQEACSTLQLLVKTMTETQDQNAEATIKIKDIKPTSILEKCSQETDETVKLLENATNFETKDRSQLNEIVSNLKNLKDVLQTLRENFLSNADTLIQKGVEVTQSLNKVEDKVFCLEKDIEIESSLSPIIKDNILLAIHSVYSSISNMRSAVTSIQKQYMFENFGKPSEAFLRCIKNISKISQNDCNNYYKSDWKKISKSLRNVLNHFEDVKFYVNFDKTARIPSDAAFTKVILEELKANLNGVVVPRAAEIDSSLSIIVTKNLKYLQTHLDAIKSRQTLEVREKIPIFKEVASNLLNLTESILAKMIGNKPETEIEQEQNENQDTKSDPKEENLVNEDTESKEQEFTEQKQKAEFKDESHYVESKQNVEDAETKEKRQAEAELQEENDDVETSSLKEKEEKVDSRAKEAQPQASSKEKVVADAKKEVKEKEEEEAEKDAEVIKQKGNDKTAGKNADETAWVKTEGEKEEEKDDTKEIEMESSMKKQEVAKEANASKELEPQVKVSTEEAKVELIKANKEFDSKALVEEEKTQAKVDQKIKDEVDKTKKETEEAKAIVKNTKEESEATARKEKQEGETRAKQENDDAAEAETMKEKYEADPATEKEEARAEDKVQKENNKIKTKEDAEDRAHTEKEEPEIQAKKEEQEAEDEAKKEKAVVTPKKEKIVANDGTQTEVKEAEAKKTEEEAKDMKEEEDTKEKSQNKKEEAKLKSMKEKEKAESKTKNEIEEAEAKAKKEAEETEAETKKREEEAEAKAKKDKEDSEAKASIKEEEAETKDKDEKEAEAQTKKEKEEAGATTKKEGAAAKAKKEEEDTEAKVKKRKEDTEAKAKKEKEDADNEAQKEKKEAEAKARNEEEKAEVKAKKEMEDTVSKVKKEQEVAEIEVKKEEVEAKAVKEESEAKARTENDEAEAKAAKEKDEAVVKAKKGKEDAEARAKREKDEAESKVNIKKEVEAKNEEAEVNAQKEKEEAKAKKETDDAEARAKKEKEEAETKVKEEEAESKAEKDELKAKAKKEKEESEDKTKKEKDQAEAKEKKDKEDAGARAKKEKEEAEAKAKKEEDEAKIKKEKEEAAAKIKKEQEEADTKAKKEEEEAEAKAKEEKEEAETKDKKEKEEAEARAKKEKEEAEAKAKKEKDEAKLKKEKEEAAAKIKIEKEEAEAKAKKEKEEAEAKAKKEKEEAEAKAKKEKEEAESKAKIEKEEAEARAKKEKEEAEAKAKKEEDEAKVKKEKEEAAAKIIKEKEEAEAKAKKEKAEAEAKAKKEKEEAESKAKKEKEEAEARAKKEKEEAEAKAKKEEDEAKVKKEKEEAEAKAKKEKEEAEAKAKKEKEEAEARAKKEKEEAEAKAKKEKHEAKFKKEKEEAAAKIKIEKEEAEAKAKKEKEEAEAKAKKEKEEAEAKAKKEKEEAEAKAKKEKEKAEAKAKKEEVEAKVKKEKEEAAAKIKKEKEEAEAKAKKEKEEAEAKAKKVKEEAEAKVTKEKEEAEARAKEEKEKAEAEAKKEEDEAKVKKDKEKAAAKIKKENEEAEAKKMKELTEARAKKEKEDAEARAKKEKEEADAKAKNEETEAKAKKEKEEAVAKAKKEKGEAKSKAKKEKEEAEARAKNEKDDAEARAMIEKEEAEAKANKEKAEAKVKKEKEEAEAKAKKEKEEAEAKAKKEKEEAEAKAKKEEDEANVKKDKEEAAAKIMKENEEVEAKKMKEETEARAKKEKEEAEARADKEKEEAEVRALKDQENAENKATKDKEEAEAKTKKEKEETEAKAKKKKKEAIAKAKKEKEDAEAKAKTEKEEAEAKAKRDQEEAEVKAKKEKEEAEAKFKKEKEEAEAKVKKEKEEAEAKAKKEKKEAEAKAKKEKEDAEAMANKKKEESDAKLKKEKEDASAKALKDTDVKAKNQIEAEAKANKEKGEAEAKAKKEKEEVEAKSNKEKADEKSKKEKKVKAKGKKEKEETEVRAKKEQEKAETKANKSKVEAEAIQAQSAKEKTKAKTKEVKEEAEEKCQKDMEMGANKEKEIKEMEVRAKKEKVRAQKEKIDETVKTGKYVEELRRDNGDIYGRGNQQQNARDQDHYSKKYDDREKPRFIDHNHKDYTMEFARPSAYTERSSEDKPISLFDRDRYGKSAIIYKAHTIVLDSQLRSSVPPLPDIPRREEMRREESERRSETRYKSKAVSEARSILSEKRSSVPRDLKRKPVFSTYLTDRTAVEGSRVKLTCSVLSSGDPSITWYRNGTPIENKLQKYRTKFMDGLITLEVLNAVPSDSAEYSCTVENENGSISSSANLKVYPSFESSPIPPTFTRSIRDTYHLAENELVLECRIRGQPLPSITWFKDDKSIDKNERYQACYLADGVCRLSISSPTPEDSGKYTCKAENSVWSDQITHVVSFTGKESRLSPNIATLERSHFQRQVMESRRPHFTNVLTDYKVASGGTIGLQVEIRGSPAKVEWLREGRSVTELYRNARTFVEHGLYTMALSDVTEKETGLYTCRAWSTHGAVDMNAAITVVQPNELEGKPAIIVGRPEKDVLISVGEDLNISFRAQGEPRPKVAIMKGIRDITTSQRVCKMTSDDYVKFTLKRSVISDAGTYCIMARNAYGCDRAFVTVVIRQRASSENLISDWTYPMDDSVLSVVDRQYRSVPQRIPGEPTVADAGDNWVSLAWPKPDGRAAAPVTAYRVESWLLGKEGGARWVELGITPLNSFDAFNLKQGEEYHFRVTPRNRFGWGESVQTSSPVGVGLAGISPEFVDILPGQLKVLLGETATLSCSVKGKPIPDVVWMKNGHEIDEEERRMSTSFNGYECSLLVKDIQPEDEARYSCEASNAHGRASTYARLAVVTDRQVWEADAKLKRERSADAQGEYPPQFTMRLRDRRVQATYPVRLTCQVVGKPPPLVTWYKDGAEVVFDKRHTASRDELFHTLEIAPTALEDGGVYEAMARNDCGAVCCRCCLVVDKGIRAYVAPEFCLGLEPLYRLLEGEELRITAVVEAYPSVGVTWYRDGVRLRPSRRAIMTLDHDGQIELALAAVTPRDAGVYTCAASNEVGRASTSGKVQVIEGDVREKKRIPPMVVSPDGPYSKEPMFIRKPRSSEAREGDTVIIACEVIGDPKPDVYWLRDFLKPDYYRDASHFKRVGAGPEYRFEIPHAKLDYTGAYSVVAKNVHGEAKAIISLQILARDPSSTEEHNVRYGRVDEIPRFARALTDLLSHDGDVVEFECRVTGRPDPDIRWFHYNELVRDCEYLESSWSEGCARLRIRGVTADDEGRYSCEASNTLGKALCSACLIVYPPGEPNTLSQRLRRPPALLSATSTPRSTPRTTPARSLSRAFTPGLIPERSLHSPSRQMAPKFYTVPFNKVVEEGETAVFQCAVGGLPAPWATWDKDGVIITPSSRVTIKEKDEMVRQLVIEQVTAEDVGLYRVTLENDYGQVEACARLEMITHSGRFCAGVRAYSASPRRATNRGRSLPRHD